MLDYNRSKDLKNIKDFKLKQLDGVIFENNFNDLDEVFLQIMPNRKELIGKKIYENTCHDNSDLKEDISESLYI